MTYLIIKTGATGTKLNTLYDNYVLDNNGNQVSLAGEHRLAGPWLKEITQAAKKKGITGSLSVFYFTEENANLVAAGKTQTYLKIKGINMNIVGIIHKSQAELKEIAEQASKHIKETISFTSPIKGIINPTQYQIRQHNEAVRQLKQERNYTGSQFYDEIVEKYQPE